ncbi:MAG: SIMPL domain-containing protein [Candidatus Coatesbacteria bacterium]|nr:MAG: SIMPL domain-containing protein [Candidatus Coatesbacteria bacterium]
MKNYTTYCFALVVIATAVTAAGETFTFTIPDAYLKHGVQEQPVMLNVTGTGNVKAMPDQVVISAYIYTRDKKASKAYDENASKMRTLMDSLLALGVPKKNIATESLSIDTIYKEGSTKVDYFAVHRSIKIFQDDMDTISPVLDAIIDAGIEDVGSIDFVVKDLEDKYREALEGAAADCRGTADALASAMGARVVDLVSMSYDYGGYNPYDVSRWAADDLGGFAAGNQMIVPREVTTTVNVYATYEIEYTGL